MSEKEQSPLPDLQRALGITPTGDNATPTPPSETPWERRQRLYKEHMEMLAKGGSNSSGKDQLKRWVRRFGR